jgi:hypothetical protein
LAKPNYGYEKRQRELAKKNKKEEKLRRKQEQKTLPDGTVVTEGDPDQTADGEIGQSPSSEPPAA